MKLCRSILEKVIVIIEGAPTKHPKTKRPSLETFQLQNVPLHKVPPIKRPNPITSQPQNVPSPNVLGGTFWGLGLFEAWDVLELGCFRVGTFWSWDVMGLGRFGAGTFLYWVVLSWDILSSDVL